VLLGIQSSHKSADETHPFGYGGGIYVGEVMVAIMLFSIDVFVSLYEEILCSAMEILKLTIQLKPRPYMVVCCDDSHENVENVAPTER
jgi:divalent metal cation (Fe/Co/Zn/Cd) transporter